MKINVYIATRDRIEKLKACITSITKGTIHPDTIVVIHQGKTPLRISDFACWKDVKIIETPIVGKSRALNLGMRQAKADILVFTDDDCIVDAHWLEHIVLDLQMNDSVVGVFGRTLPYQSVKHVGHICPCTYTFRKKRIISTPSLHWKTVGYGNNMAFRKAFFDANGMFKEWLGPGSIGDNAEDAECILRALVGGNTLLYDPKITLYHNKWLDKNEIKKQLLSYACGEMACYAYYAFLGKKFASRVVRNDFKYSFYDLKRIVGDIVIRKIYRPHDWAYSIHFFLIRLKGFAIAFVYFFKEVVDGKKGLVINY